MDLTESQIEKILTDYKKKRERENKYYHEVSKHSEEFKEKNRERAKNHYHNKGKDMKSNQYQDNKEFVKARSLYNYYKKRDKLDVFKEKHEEKCKILIDKGFQIE
jgi:catalase